MCRSLLIFLCLVLFSYFSSADEPKEKSFEIKLNGNRLFCAYQPVKKQITYDIDRGMNPGNHQLDIVVNDRVGNKKSHTVSFTCK